MFKVNNKDTRTTPLASIVNFEQVSIGCEALNMTKGNIQCYFIVDNIDGSRFFLYKNPPFPVEDINIKLYKLN